MDTLLQETASSGLEPLEGRVRDDAEAELRARLGEDAYAAMYADGRGLALDEALALASAQTEPESRCRGEGFDGERFLLARAVGSRWNADEVSAEAKPVFPHGSLSPPETMSAS